MANMKTGDSKTMNRSQQPTAVHPASQGLRTTLIGILLNACLAAIKLGAGILGNSYALIADAIESTFDIFSSMVVWVGLKIASKPADRDHPYGHGKAEPLTATAISLALMTAAIVIANQSVHEIRMPHHAPASFTLLVLFLVVVTRMNLHP